METKLIINWLEDLEKRDNERYKTLSDQITKLTGYLHNDGGTGRPGLIKEFDDHKKIVESFVSEYHTTKKVDMAKATQRAAWIGAIFGFIGGVGTALSKVIFEKLHGG